MQVEENSNTIGKYSQINEVLIFQELFYNFFEHILEHIYAPFLDLS